MRGNSVGGGNGQSHRSIGTRQYSDVTTSTEATAGGRDAERRARDSLRPTIRRLDVVASAATVVFTRVARVEFVAGIEAIFRRETGEYLIVAVGGKVIVRS
jgi:hypothetical protein